MVDDVARGDLSTPGVSSLRMTALIIGVRGGFVQAFENPGNGASLAGKKTRVRGPRR